MIIRDKCALLSSVLPYFSLFCLTKACNRHELARKSNSHVQQPGLLRKVLSKRRPVRSLGCRVPSLHLAARATPDLAKPPSPAVLAARGSRPGIPRQPGGVCTDPVGAAPGGARRTRLIPPDPHTDQLGTSPCAQRSTAAAMVMSGKWKAVLRIGDNGCDR